MPSGFWCSVESPSRPSLATGTIRYFFDVCPRHGRVIRRATFPPGSIGKRILWQGIAFRSPPCPTLRANMSRRAEQFFSTRPRTLLLCPIARHRGRGLGRRRAGRSDKLPAFQRRALKRRHRASRPQSLPRILFEGKYEPYHMRIRRKSCCPENEGPHVEISRSVPLAVPNIRHVSNFAFVLETRRFNRK